MGIKKNKKGSNVSFVISFVLFIIFVVFIYALVNSRVGNAQSKENVLTGLEQNVIPAISGNLTTVSIDVNQSGSQTCVLLSGFLTNTGIGNNIFVQDSLGKNYQASYSGGDLYINRNASTGTNFFRIYSSPEFPSIQALPLGGCVQSYNPGILVTDGYVLKSKVSLFLQNYSSNYPALKKNMDLLSSDEFGFAFTYSNGTKVSTKVSNLTVSVYSETVPVQYVDSSSGINSGSVEILVW